MFFYQNEFGSRVFFDDLGPPWPKHPCTDNASTNFGPSRPASIGIVTGPVRPQVGAALPPSETPTPLAIGHPVEHYVAPTHTGDGWDRCIVKKRSIREETAYFVVFNASDPANKSIRFSTIWRPDLPSAEEILYLKGDRMSFFSFEDFAPLEVDIERKVSKAVASARKRKARRKRRRK